VDGNTLVQHLSKKHEYTVETVIGMNNSPVMMATSPISNPLEWVFEICPETCERRLAIGM